MSQPLWLLATASVVLAVSSGVSDAAAVRSPQGTVGRLSGRQRPKADTLFVDVKRLRPGDGPPASVSRTTSPFGDCLRQFVLRSLRLHP